MAGGLNDIIEGGAAAGGRSVGVGLAVWTAYRLFVFVCNFFAGRYDARQARLDALDVRLAKSLGDRLSHLEVAELNNQARIRVLEDCVAILAAELRQTDPSNSKLGQVAKLLRDVHPIVPPDPNLDELMQHAANAVDRKGRKS
jgi:uncharacterized small protein (DUF1192 family)